MKTRFALVVLVLFLFTGCSGIRKIETDQLHNIDLSAVNEQQDLSILMEIAEGKPIKEPLVMKLPKGYRLPVHMTVNTPLAKMDSKCGTLVFSQDLFLYLTQSSMLVSPDKTNWVNMSDFDGVKKLFGWSDGSLAVGIGASRENGSLLGVKIGVEPDRSSAK